MDPISSKTALAAAGAGTEPLYVDDVFSTFLYEGDQTNNRQITNGIDLSGEGGLTWIKSRTSTDTHVLYDTERTSGYALRSSSNGAELTYPDRVTFNSDGFDVGVGSYGYTNDLQDYVSWSFRKAPGFFDVVTWTGDGTGTRNISHSLGSTPGCVILKRVSNSSSWYVQHRSLSNGFDSYLTLDTTNSETATGSQVAVSSTELTLGSYYNVSSYTYVAYIFAHDDQSFGTNGDEAIIKCGSFSGSIGNGGFVDLGFEPQWVMTKRVDSTSDWTMCDIMRGATDNFATTGRLKANKSDAEDNFRCIFPQPTGFLQYVEGASAATMIYIAIRRPHKPPTDGTDVFAPQASRAASDGTSSQLHFTSNFPVDLLFQLCRAGNSANVITVDRLRGGQYLSTSSNAAEQSTIWKFDSMDGVYFTTSTSATSDFGANMFRRAPGFFDVVAYTGNSSARDINHSLGVTPQLIILKSRTLGESWPVLSTLFSDVTANRLTLNLNGALSSGTSGFFRTPTATTFGIGSAAPSEGQWNRSGEDYIAYLFATLDGISKVGTYSGTGSDVDVDCGFSAGARFVLIKRTDSTGDWYVWDTARGIATGNDPYLLLNSSSAEVTSTDYIDPLNSGFTVTSSAPAALNASGGTYLFLAIA